MASNGIESSPVEALQKLQLADIKDAKQRKAVYDAALKLAWSVES